MENLREERKVRSERMLRQFEEDRLAFEKLNDENAMNGTLRRTVWKPNGKWKKNLDAVMMKFAGHFRRFVLKQMKEFTGIKLWVNIDLSYEKVSRGEEKNMVSAFFRSKARVIESTNEIDEIYQSIWELMNSRNDTFQKEGSGLRIYKIHSVTVQLAKHQPLSKTSNAYGKMQRKRCGKIGCYTKLPDFIARKEAVINVQNNDQKCFAYSLLAAIYQVKRNPQRPSNYKRYFEEYGFNDIEYPIDVLKFEELEKYLGIGFNVFKVANENGSLIYRMFTTKVEDPFTAINLLLYDNHFSWVKSIPRLFCNKQETQCNLICMRCLSRMYSKRKFDLHVENCRGTEDYPRQVLVLPEPGSSIKFKNVRHQMRFPFVIYADFEAMTIPMDDQKKKTHFYQKHHPIAVGYKVVCEAPIDAEFPYTQYVGKDCVEWFLRKLLEVEEKILSIITDKKRLVMKAEDWKNFYNATICHICEQPLYPPKGEHWAKIRRVVRDHDHITGAYRGAAHDDCNFKLRMQFKIPVFFHNFRGYDSHLICQAIGKFKDRSISVIGQNMERYLTMSWGTNIVFKDSYQFMNASLEQLTVNLKKAGSGKFKIFFDEFPSEQKQMVDDLLLSKGVFPYDWLNSEDRLHERQLPPMQAFDSMLTKRECAEQDYAKAMMVWKTFKCRRMNDYMKLYLKTDVLLLACVFESFRNVCLSQYGLDPSYYVSSPNLSWDAMLKITNVELECISDVDMFQMIDSGIRGGICGISHRQATANNPLMGEEFFESEKPLSYLLYLDANNLYGYAMAQPMPFGEFQWVGKEELGEIDWLKQTRDQPWGYIVECDIDYPESLHDVHNDYPLLPTRKKIRFNMLSDFQREIFSHYEMKRYLPQEKLLCTLENKRNYVVHYNMLRFCMEEGLKLVKVHRAVKFRQSRWLAPYINLNQRLRAECSTDFEKDFFKLMNNAVYGKTCENQKKRTSIKLVQTEEKAKKYIQLPNCMDFRIFNKNLVGVEMQKDKPLIDKPFYVGFTVLEESKLHMQKFYYRHLKSLYADKVKMCFTDTDSFIVQIETDNAYQDMWEHKDFFDFSDYPKDNIYYDATNKKVLGKMKDECAGKVMIDYVGLRPKMYSYRWTDDGAVNEKHRAKGVQRAASNRITHHDYIKELFKQEEARLTNRRIGAKLHEVYSLENKKRSLCAFDDKRYLLSDLVSTLAFGHKSLEKSVENDAEFIRLDNQKTQRAIVRQKGGLAKRNRSIRTIDAANEEYIKAKKARLDFIEAEEVLEDAKDVFDEWPDYYMC